LGYNAEAVEVLIGQMVNLLRDGKAVKMSKRAGTVITMNDLVEAMVLTARATHWFVLLWINPSISTLACGLRNLQKTLCTTCSTDTLVCALSSARPKKSA